MATFSGDDIKAQVDRCIADFRAFNVKAENNIEKKILDSALVVEADAKRLFKGRDDPSVKGEPPRVDTGRLRASITHRGTRGDHEFYAEVGTNVEYAQDVEEGTSRTWPHPFLVPALAMNEEKIQEAIARAVQEAANA